MDASGTESSDEALIARVREGTKAAYASLMARHAPRIYRLALRVSHNAGDAEEITQETFLRAYAALDSFQGASRFGTWLYRIALNEALLRRRSASRRPTESLERLAPGVAAAALAARPLRRADDLLEDKALAGRVRAALEQLDPPSRAALVLRDVEELTAGEVAEILGVTPEAARQRAHRARLKLRVLLADLSVEAA